MIVRMILSFLLLFSASSAWSQTCIQNGLPCGSVTTVNGVAPVNGDISFPTTVYVSGFTPNSPGRLTDLYVNAPCVAAKQNQYAVVQDLYGALTESLRCTNFGGWGYEWRSTIPFYAAVMTTTGGTITISCNLMPPVVVIQGVLTTNLNIVFSPTHCPPGQRQEIQMMATLGLYSANATGLIGNVTKLLNASSSSLYVFDTAGWRPY
jgi:hypothetical protein